MQKSQTTTGLPYPIAKVYINPVPTLSQRLYVLLNHAVV